jgi:hypothetical protein
VMGLVNEDDVRLFLDLLELGGEILVLRHRETIT